MDWIRFLKRRVRPPKPKRGLFKILKKPDLANCKHRRWKTALKINGNRITVACRVCGFRKQT